MALTNLCNVDFKDIATRDKFADAAIIATPDAIFMVGSDELRGEDLFNTVLVAERGNLVGTYSKAFPCYDYFTSGRDFPVFERDGIKFGVVICVGGGYIEPTRILALKGAREFAETFNE